MRKFIIRKIVFLFFVFITSNVFAQTDTEFWFVVPEISAEHMDKPIRFVFTTTDFAADITMEMPANPGFTPINLSLPANTTKDTSFTNAVDIINFENRTIIEQLADPTGDRDNISNMGIHITSTAPIIAYYEINTTNNSDMWSLKGRAGLGQEFYIPFQDIGQNRHRNHLERAWSSIEIIGTGGTTVVEITPADTVYRNGSFPQEAAPFTIALEQGEVYTVAPGWRDWIYHGGLYGWWGVFRDQHIGGTYIKVKTGDDIAVVVKDDSVCEDLKDSPSDPHPVNPTGGWDIIADQWVPKRVLGTEYVALRGDLVSDEEYLFAVAIEDNTKIWWNAGGIDTTVAAVDTVVNKGDQVRISFPNTEDYKYIISNHKLSVLHITGDGSEFGGAALPPIDRCTGSTQVGFSRSTNSDYHLNIMVRAAAKDGFLINGATPSFFNAADFTEVPGTPWSVARIQNVSTTNVPVDVTTILSNTKDVFHLGIVNETNGGAGCRYAYFSNYGEDEINAFAIIEGQQPTTNPRAYVGDSIQLSASGGTSYNWWPDENINDTSISNPKVYVTGSKIYYVEVSGFCDQIDTATISISPCSVPNAEFSIDENIGNSPLTVGISNIGDDNSVYRWYWDDDDLSSPDSLSFSNDPFTHTYTNTSDSIEIQKLTLITEGSCGRTDTLKKQIIVYPNDISIGDNVFWFSAPEVNRYHAGGSDASPDNTGSPVYLHLTTFEDPAVVTISMPANAAFFNGGRPIDTLITANTTVRLDLTNFVDDGSVNQWNSMENKLRWTTSDLLATKPYINRNNKGIKINSSSEITAYYEIGVQYNMDLITLKGENALGTEFYVPFQTTHETRVYNYLYRPYSSIDIVATEDNTKINITVDKSIWVKDGVPEELPAGTYSIWLHKGETSIITPYENIGGAGYQTSFSQRLAGAYVEVDQTEGSGGPITIISHDDIVKSNFSFNPDYVIDQLVPIDYIGTDYAVIQGVGYDDVLPGLEIEDYVYVVGTQAGTNFTVKRGPGGYTSNHSVGAGGTVAIAMDSLTKRVVTVNSDNPVYVYHMSGTGRQKAGAIIPALSDCSGSDKVAFNRTKGGVYAFYLNILVKNTAIGSFSLTKDGGLDVDDLSVLAEINDPANYDVLPESGDPYDDWSYARIDASLLDVNVAYLLVNSTDNFHIGVLNGQTGNDAFYGYFSNFGPSSVSVEVVSAGGLLGYSCNGDTVQLFASGGTLYEWTPADYLDDPFSATPKAVLPTLGAHTYQVNIVNNCGLDTTVTVKIENYPMPDAHFKLSDSIGCAPLEITIQNESSGADIFKWDFDNDSSWDLETLDSTGTFIRTYNNTNSTDTTYYISMEAKQTGIPCTDSYVDTIIVYPEVNASFTIDTNMGESPLDINISGIGDAPTYNWFWDDDDLITPDYVTSSNEPFSHTYLNPGSSDVVNNLTLIGENGYGCYDTTSTSVTVQSGTSTDFDISTDRGCSPVLVMITNNSIGGTYNWYWDNDDLSVSDLVTGDSSLAFFHVYENSTGRDSIYYLTLIADYGAGVYDTVQKPIIVYSSVDTEFLPDINEGCNPLSVDFTRSSISTDSCIWNFGDGTDSVTWENVNHIFSNSGLEEKVFTVTLTVESDNGCIDSAKSDVTVAPYVEADFNIDQPDLCEPGFVDITNTSVTEENSSFEWSFGDGPISNVKDPGSYLYKNDQDTALIYYMLLRVTNSYDCWKEKIKPITVEPKLRSEVTDYSDSICLNSSNGYIDLTVFNGNPPYSFNWSNEETSEDLSNLPVGIYICEISDSNDCMLMDTTEIFGLETPDGQEICLVGVDKSINKYRIDWNNNDNEATDAYNLYRRNSDQDEFESIAQIISNNTSFVDSTATPGLWPYEYKISVIDTCGGESELSESHKSIFLSSQNTGDQTLLTWEPYLVEEIFYNFINHVIYRGEDSLSLVPIDTISAYNTSYLDDHSSLTNENRYYRVAGLHSENCMSVDDSDLGLVFSNMVRHTISTGMNDQETNPIGLEIFPNPFSDNVNIQFILEQPDVVEIDIYDMLGRKVTKLAEEVKGPGTYQYQFNPHEYNARGSMYFIKVKINNDIIMRKVVKFN